MGLRLVSHVFFFPYSCLMFDCRLFSHCAECVQRTLLYLKCHATATSVVILHVYTFLDITTSSLQMLQTILV